MADNTTKAQQLVKEAEKKASNTGFFDTIFSTKEEIYIQVSKLYISAAAQYKLAKDWLNAGKCYENAAIYDEKAREYTNITNYSLAIECYTKLPYTFEQFTEIEKVASKLFKHFESEGNFYALGKLAETLGTYNQEIYSTDYFEKALKYYDASDKKYAKKKCLETLANIHIKNKNYVNAASYLKQLIENINIDTEKIIFSTTNIYNYLFCTMSLKDAVEYNKALQLCSKYTNISSYDYAFFEYMKDHIDNYKGEMSPRFKLLQWQSDILDDLIVESESDDFR